MAGRSGQIAFRPRARLLKLIGSELISDDVVAVTELVKNAHDADANRVSVEFRDVTGQEGEIVIRDDGCGMDLDTLLERWMQPANSFKAGNGKLYTPKGRRYLGEKGVGRFAVDKLGSRLELVTKSRKSPDEILAWFDWDAFDDGDRMLADIKNRWEMRKAVSARKKGTLLRVQGLRSQWSERMFRRLSTRLSRLLFPFRDKDNFSIVMASDEFPEYSGELKAGFLAKAPYRIDASFDGLDSVSVSLGGGRPASHVWNGAGELICGPARVRIFAFDLETDALASIGPCMEVRAWLKEWTGISVYRDKFRIWPYGEPYDDWLRLDQRRVNNPVVRLSNNQVVGFVEISADVNPELKDQTNREGLFHNQAFEDLRRLVHFVLQILEAERRTIRHPGGVQKKIVASAGGNGYGAVLAALDKMATKRKNVKPEELAGLAKRLRKAHDKDRAEQLRLTQGISELAASGLAAVRLHETVQPICDQIERQYKLIRDVATGKGSRKIRNAANRLETNVDLIRQRLSMLASPDATSSARKRTIDIMAEIDAFWASMDPVIWERNLDIEVRNDCGSVVRTEMRPESFALILHVLSMNSLDWMQDVDSPAIRVVVAAKGGKCEILFSDNGPGIQEGIVDKVFEPMFSMKEAGKGMGLTVVKNIVEMNNGSITVLRDKRRKGANIMITLPRKKPRKTR